MQRYEYGDAREAVAERGDDASRVISFFIFNTEVHFHAYASDGQSASDPTVSRRLDAALAACRDRCLYFEHRLSRTRPESDICRAHSCAPAEVGIAPETADLIRRSLGYCERSRGTFDVTMGTVTRLWDFHEGVVPSPLSLSRALPHLGCSHIHLGGTAAAPTLSIDDPETVLDLGGVAKGYIADDLAGILLDHGVERFVINLGGNVLVRGGRPRDDASRPPVHAGVPWKIGIINPRDPAHYRAIVDVSDGSVVTSGLHERRFTRGGRTYHHILGRHARAHRRGECDHHRVRVDRLRRLFDCGAYVGHGRGPGVRRGDRRRRGRVHQRCGRGALDVGHCRQALFGAHAPALVGSGAPFTDGVL